jgi:hypothetical protein
MIFCHVQRLNRLNVRLCRDHLQIEALRDCQRLNMGC